MGAGDTESSKLCLPLCDLLQGSDLGEWKNVWQRDREVGYLAHCIIFMNMDLISFQDAVSADLSQHVVYISGWLGQVV